MKYDSNNLRMETKFRHSVFAYRKIISNFHIKKRPEDIDPFQQFWL